MVKYDFNVSLTKVSRHISRVKNKYKNKKFSASELWSYE